MAISSRASGIQVRLLSQASGHPADVRKSWLSGTFCSGIFFPGFERTLWTNPFLVATHASELAMMLWLLIMGLNVRQWERRALEFA
jgi:hypothetical protein